MNLPKLHLSCLKDQLRKALNYVQIRKDYVASTNSHVVVWYNTSDLFDKDFIDKLPEEGILVHREDWAKIQKSTHCRVDNGIIYASSPKFRKILIEVVNADEMRFPDWRAVIPNNARASIDVDSIGLNPNYVHLVGKILETENLKFEFIGRRGIVSCLIRSTFDDDKGTAMVLGLDIRDSLDRIVTFN